MQVDGLNEAHPGNQQHCEYGCQSPKRLVELGRQPHSYVKVLYLIQLPSVSQEPRSAGQSWQIRLA